MTTLYSMLFSTVTNSKRKRSFLLFVPGSYSPQEVNFVFEGPHHVLQINYLASEVSKQTSALLKWSISKCFQKNLTD